MRPGLPPHPARGRPQFVTTASRRQPERVARYGNAWTRLLGELDAWSADGRQATLWWRDDDADSARPALQRLLALQAWTGVPLALAVVPRALNGSLADAVGGQSGIAILQHGYSHDNFAATGDRKIELDGSRPSEYVAADLAVGLEKLSSFPGWIAVLVPPWNRIAGHLVPLLPELGYRGLSTIGSRARRHPVARLTQNNVHIDPIDWRGRFGPAGGFVGEDFVLDCLTTQLRERREGHVDSNETTGLMTHHKVQSGEVWDFVARLVERTNAHPAVRWCAASELFAA
jgi:hypothetical protein